MSITRSSTRLLIGSAISTIKKQGIAPMIGPKNGITFVTPTITLISTAYGRLSIVETINIINPIISESSILPLINCPKILYISERPSRILFAFFTLNTAYTIFFPLDARYSLFAITYIEATIPIRKLYRNFNPENTPLPIFTTILSTLGMIFVFNMSCSFRYAVFIYLFSSSSGILSFWNFSLIFSTIFCRLE